MTPEEIQQIAARVAEVLAASSQGVGEVPVVDSVAGIVSLPAIKQVGSIETVVSAPIALLKGKDGREVSFRLTETAIQWQYTGGQWTDLISRKDLLLPATELIYELQEIITLWSDTIKQQIQTATENANTAAENVKDGKTPVIRAGETETLAPGAEAKVESTEAGFDPEGRPITDFKFKIPSGQSGVWVGKQENAPDWARVIIDPDGEDVIDPDVLSQIAWGQEIMEGQSSTDWTAGQIGNRSLWAEYESKCGRYLLKNDGSMAKISPYNGNEFIDGTPVDEAKGHVMYYEPRLFFLVKTDSTTGKTYLWQSMQNIGGKELPPLCVGAYMGYRAGNALTSRSGVVPARSRSISNFWADAQANGPQFGLGDYNYRKRLLMKGLMKYGNTNIQAMLGNGVSGSANRDLWAKASTFLTGATKDMGDQYGKIDIEVVNGEIVGVDCSRVNFGGIEDPYGWYWEMIQGVYFGSSNNPEQVGNEIFIYQGNRMPTGGELTTHPDGEYRQLTRLTSSGWMRAIILGDDFDIFSKTLGGGSTSYWADYSYNNNTGQLLLFGGSASYGSYAGLGYAHSYYAFSSSYSSFGARLAYYGDIRFVDGKDI